MPAEPNYKKRVSIVCTCYKGEEYIEAFLKNVEEQTIFSEIEILLDHNEPTEKEIELVSEFIERYPDSMNHRVVFPVNMPGASINRCIRDAHGKYLTTWSVDDQRTPDALERMCETLDKNPWVGFTYGDFLMVNGFMKKEGDLHTTPEFETVLFREGVATGPFIFWRSDLTEKAGYWDEQFYSGSDYDFLARLARWTIGKKTSGVLGYFLNIGEGSSTGGSHVRRNIQPIERTAIEMRYGLYNKTIQLKGYPYVQAARKYQTDKMCVNGQWQSVEKYVPNYRKMLGERKTLQKAFEKEYRCWLLKHYCNVPNRTRDGMKWCLTKMGLLENVKELKRTLGGVFDN